jgi:hypothetical protein
MVEAPFVESMSSNEVLAGYVLFRREPQYGPSSVHCREVTVSILRDTGTQLVLSSRIGA